jgi:hypothetical protein
VGCGEQLSVSLHACVHEHGGRACFQLHASVHAPCPHTHMFGRTRTRTYLLGHIILLSQPKQASKYERSSSFNPDLLQNQAPKDPHKKAQQVPQSRTRMPRMR